MEFWEILVPTTLNCGKPIRTRQHREWDSRIRRISNGLTIMKPAIGQWINPEGKLFQERMIPVRIIATKKQMEKIVKITLSFYEQEVVLAYKISSDIMLVYAKGDKNV